MTDFPGSCHCGAVQVVLHSNMTPEAMRVGRCGCSFCRRHGARTMGDRNGAVSFRAEAGSLNRYRFGLGITDYLLCGRCGAYVGAVMEDTNGPIGIVNVNALDIRDRFDPAPPLHDYDGEDEAGRRARRRKFWMPTTVVA